MADTRTLGKRKIDTLESILDDPPVNAKRQCTHSAVPDAVTSSFRIVVNSTRDSTALVDMATSMFNAECTRSSRCGNEHHLARHTDITPLIRAETLDWLMETSTEFKCCRETLHLACNYMDRYLSTRSNLSRTKIKLLAVTCLFLASKVEDICPVTVNDAVHAVFHAYTINDIFKMELSILCALSWRMHVFPTTYSTLLTMLKLVDVHSSFRPFTHDGGNYGAKCDDVNVLLSNVSFARMMDILDTALFFVHSLYFTSSELAIAAIRIVHSKRIADGVMDSVQTLVSSKTFTVDRQEEAYAFLASSHTVDAVICAGASSNAQINPSRMYARQVHYTGALVAFKAYGGEK